MSDFLFQLLRLRTTFDSRNAKERKKPRDVYADAKITKGKEGRLASHCSSSLAPTFHLLLGNPTHSFFPFFPSTTFSFVR